ncbi:hypothetical protein [Candidatus Ruminimicrobium bovinum]|uniref:hypothetical protein n=1 Tax=Candidatus Ruminimicrobium bovinum TaxID=3242779 RepID=UPI0039B8C255
MKEIKVKGKKDLLLNKEEIQKEILNIEKIFQCKYRIDSTIGINYASEKFTLGLRYLSVSNGNLKERIYGAYLYNIIYVLWNFDYKKYLSNEYCKKWEFLQKELNYKTVNIFKHYKEITKSHLEYFYREDYNRYERYNKPPLFFNSYKNKNIKMAEAIFDIAIDLEYKTSWK